LGSKSLSDFYLDVDTYQSIKQGLGDSMDIISGTKKQTEDEKAVLEDKKSEQIDLRRIQVLQQQKIQQQEKEKNNLLKITKGLENEYQKILKDKEASAAKIRSALFSLEGSQAIQFGDAVRYANEVYSNLGVRPAFLLGIIAEESNLGQNVGTGNWKTDMHPTRDVPVFQQITSELGLNPDKMPVSKKAWYGWGGAMGPAQVIPSTWILFKDRLAKISGSNPPNPWNARDALFAAGLILKDNGASDGTRAAERLAALRYLAGWKNATKKAYAFYGDDVMDLADKYQSQINILNK
jgi:membrane-bound lytic murein transglycosylase B